MLLTGCNNGDEGLLDNDSDFQEPVYQLIITATDDYLPIGFTMQMQVEALRSDNTVIEIRDTSTLKWSSSDESVAVVNEFGVITAKGEGPVTITATGMYKDETYSDTAYILITNSEINTIIVTPDNANIPAGFSQQFKAVATFTDGTKNIDITNNKNLTWSVSEGSQFVEIDENGRAVAISTGSGTITATGKFSAKIIVTNVTISINTVTIIELIVTPKDAAISAGLSVQFKAEVIFSDDSTPLNVTEDRHITWSVTKGKEFAKIDKKGHVTGIRTGDAIITATGEFYNDTTIRNVNLHVNDAEVTGLVVTPTDGVVLVKSTLQFNAKATYSDGSSSTDVTESSDVTWSVSAGSSFVEIDDNGLATSFEEGNATITATGNINGRVVDDSVSLDIFPRLLAPIIPAARDKIIEPSELFSSIGLMIQVRGWQPALKANDEIEVHVYTDGCGSAGSACTPVDDFVFCTFDGSSDTTQSTVNACMSVEETSPLANKKETAIHFYYIINGDPNIASEITDTLLETI
ncbi:Ig-like domain-containing protein [Psychromonas sp. CNPT3]|uniref:Ig-like domain-containing protein n=1 Tax=Psychromonas sp. CNPT3 TaxID=314282 RepID=UPI0018DC39F0|nr:Ig-like domain-containing protein [Psychromonas sp. CNPT3]